jgi:galactokinase
MMGGGFGGCTINLVETGQVAAFVAHMAAAYEQQTGIKLDTYETTIVDGVGPARG